MGIKIGKLNVYTNLLDSSNYTTANSFTCPVSVQTESFSVLKHHPTGTTLPTDIIKRCVSHTTSPYAEYGQQHRSTRMNFSAHQTHFKECEIFKPPNQNLLTKLLPHALHSPQTASFNTNKISVATSYEQDPLITSEGWYRLGKAQHTHDKILHHSITRTCSWKRESSYTQNL